MASRSLNKVMLIGNLTRDPELRYTPSGAAVCTIGLATNRSWTTESGDKKEETEFHRVVAWNKLAELCSQLLTKGRKIYVEGRLRTNTWQGNDGQQRSTTEVVIEDMIILDSRRQAVAGERDETQEIKPTAATTPESPAVNVVAGKQMAAGDTGTDQTAVIPPATVGAEEDINPDDIPF